MVERILVVEDEVFVALDLQLILEDAGWSVDGPYASSRDAMAAITQHRPDCAVLDVRIEDGEVFGVADRLREAGVPFVFHSGHADEAELRRRYPAALVFSKPCSPRELKEGLSRTLTGSADRD